MGVILSLLSVDSGRIRRKKMVKDFRIPISFIGSLYKIIAKILANRLMVVLGDIVNEVQSAFIADRQILDGPFILNEVLQWCKLKKKHSFILKIDFEKGFLISVRWDYLDDVLRKFGFGEKWCGWIQECLRSSWGSVLVNGSPTEEFQFFKGLKPVESLSPFIFYFGYGESSHFLLKVGGMAGACLSINLSKTIHGEDGENGSGFKVGYKSIWRSILQEVETLKIKDMVLKQRYLRLYALKVKKTVDVASKLFPEVSTQTRWIKAGESRLTFMVVGSGIGSNISKGLYVLDMERGFLSQKGSGGGRGVKEKQQRSANITKKDTVVVSSSAVDEPVDATMNTENVNVGKTPTSPTINPKPGRNGVDVVVSVESIRATSTRFANTVYGFFLGKRLAYPVVANYVRNTQGKYRLWNADVNLLKEDVGNVSVWVKLHGVPVTAFSEDGLSVIATKLGTPLMLNSYTSNVVKNMKKPSQTPRGVPVGPKVGFKQVKQVYRHVARKNNVNTNGNKKKDVEPTIDVSNSNTFDVLNSVEMIRTSNTPMVKKIDNIERLIIEGKVTLVDDEGKPLKKVDYSGDHDSADEVASTDNDMENFLTSKKDGYGNNSLLEQWMESYMNGDYDFDPYNDDTYEGQDIPDRFQDICDN
ncbi:RNA-directed DNA polymerase, eukaryota, partial [Tanacetum coccineum]